MVARDGAEPPTPAFSVCEFRVATTGSKMPSSCRNHCRFNSVAKGSECPDHSRSSGSLSLFTDCGAAFLIVNAVVQNDPDQLTEAMCNGSDGFVVSEA